MADDYRMALEELLRKAQMEGDAAFLREAVRALAEAVMELEMTQHVGGEPYETSGRRDAGAAGMGPGSERGTRRWARSS
jgi:transposase-like protein